MGKDQRTFPDYYEEVITELEDKFELDTFLKTLLEEKRRFGLTKYKEFSFQANFENAVKVPTLEHFQEELIDGFNYILHEIYKQSLLNKKPHENLLKILTNLNEAWYNLKEIIT